MDTEGRLDTALFSNELHLLLSFMKMEKDESVLSIDKESITDINWDLFLELALHHRVFPVLYAKLRKMDVTWIPSYVIQSLYNAYQRSVFQMLNLSGEMEMLCRTFSENRIRSLVLKGPVLSFDLYGDLSLRTSRDLDILIPISALGKVIEILLKHEYDKVDEYETILNDWRWRHHHITFTHPKKGITLEIHWRLSEGPGIEPDFDELWERKRVSSLTSYPVYFLGREDLFLFLASHGARHGWSRLRWLADIDQITKQTLNFELLVTLLKKYKQLHVGAQALILASQLLHTPLTAEMKTVTAGKRPNRLAQEALFYIKQMINLHTDPVPEEVARYHKRHLFSLKSNRQKILFIMSFLYPYPEDAQTLVLPKYLHFLYFPLRPLLWAWRKTKKLALS